MSVGLIVFLAAFAGAVIGYITYSTVGKVRNKKND